MQPERLTVRSEADGLGISVLRWEAVGEKKGSVQISHGMAEHKHRYARLAEELARNGFTVYASDHRGHGESVSESVPLGDFGEAGWDGLLNDLAQLGGWVREREGAPVLLLAHSMGSMAGQQVILTHADLYDGVVFSGTSALDELAAAAAESDSEGLQSFNEPFEHRTGFEWLSRDADEVQKYIDDPLCGFDLSEKASNGFWSSGSAAADPEKLAGVKEDLPILLISGEADPVGGGDGRWVHKVADRYREAGLHDVETRLYPEARHELFNETNRDEVTAEVVSWLTRVSTAPSR
ncbi:hypothetical protein LK10_05570 [Sinomonas humi]|uniref:Serine aminopeptidase S33 domain-containing protein n=2 Tax=Sinomonas humi TaxID=1338436 RepID=A0A0B2AM51_9MICC|nr:hypothetical protein LK10_05570 [Sinomonas humi]